MKHFAHTRDVIEYYKLDELLCWDAFVQATHLDAADLHSLVYECSEFGQTPIDADQLEAILLEFKREYECFGD